MRGREIRAALQGKVDPKFVMILCDLAEQQYALNQQHNQIASNMIRLSEVMMAMTRLSDEFQKSINQMKGAEKQRGLVDVRSEPVSDS